MTDRIVRTDANSFHWDEAMYYYKRELTDIAPDTNPYKRSVQEHWWGLHVSAPSASCPVCVSRPKVRFEGRTASGEVEGDDVDRAWLRYVEESAGYELGSAGDTRAWNRYMVALRGWLDGLSQ